MDERAHAKEKQLLQLLQEKEEAIVQIQSELAVMADVVDSEVINFKREKYVEERGLNFSGKPAVYLTKKEPIYDDADQVIGLLGVSFNITNRKEMETELLQAKEKAEAGNRAKDAFILNMAHDIRTPLTGMIHMSEDLTEMVSNNEKALIRAQLLEQASKRLHELLEGVLELSKAEHIQEDELEITAVNLRILTQKLHDLLLPSIKAKGLEFKIAFDRNLPKYLETDRIKLERILLNLTANAIKFTKQGEITLAIQLLSQHRNKAKIKYGISDTGIGIPEDQLDKIFDRFVKVHPSYHGVYKGHGVGLFIVKQYVEALGGTIEVKSILEQGTTFTITLTLPIATGLEQSDQTETALMPEALDDLSAKKVKSSEPIETALSGSSPRILLIEDDFAARLGAQSRLKRAGYQIITAENVASALKHLKEQKFDLILSDIGLPDGNGMELTQQYRTWEQQNRKTYTPIVALTGHGGEEAKTKFLASGMDHVFRKPLEENDIKALHKLLQQTKPKDLSVYPLFDEALANTLFDATDLHDLIQASLKSWDETLAILKKAHEQHDWKMIAFQTHKLRGGSTYVAATRLHKVCAALSEVLSSSNKNTRATLFKQLLQTIEATKKPLQAWLNKQSNHSRI